MWCEVECVAGARDSRGCGYGMRSSGIECTKLGIEKDRFGKCFFGESLKKVTEIFYMERSQENVGSACLPRYIDDVCGCFDM